MSYIVQGNVGIKRKLNGHYRMLNHKRPYSGPRREQAKEHIEIIDLTDEPAVVNPVEQQTQVCEAATLQLLSKSVV